MNYLFSNVLFNILAAALLGLLIGWFWRKIIAVRQQWRREQEIQARLEGRDRYISQLKLELQDAEEGLELHNNALQEALEERGTEVRDQRELADEYLVRMRAAENKLMSLQRNYLVFKSQKQRELDELQDSLQNTQPRQEQLQQRIHELESADEDVDMDATLEIDNELRGEHNPFILRNALINEKRKVEHLSLVKKELSETYFRFAEDKQRWAQERLSLQTRLETLEAAEKKFHEQESIAEELLRDYNILNRDYQRLKEESA